MDVERTQPVASSQLACDAESLVRSLVGVTHARVSVGPGGIDCIDIVAIDQESAATMAARVRSALLAALATPILPARIHVRVDGQPVRSSDARVRTATNGHDRGTHRIRLLEHRGDRAPRSQPHPVPSAQGATTPQRPAHEGIRVVHGLRTGQPTDDDTAPPQPAVARPRLVAVDTERGTDGRIRCRVSVAFAARVHSADAVAIDLPGAPAQTAAQATVRALVEAGIPGLELNGLREVEIAGRDYLVVALRRTDTSRRHRSGSAPIIGSAERSAAEATVVAANELL